ncbi:MAG: hypothetical protein NXI16_16640 [Alphaproteobacteria bacterium]|nr:hypothetical protein [Alphaproteobacteria bacterium]
MHALPITYNECEAIYSKFAGLRSVLFVSAAPGEGNSTIAYALAQRAAAGGQRVLFLDLNTHQSFPRDQLGLPARSWSLNEAIPAEAFCPVGDRSLVFLPAPLERSFGIEGRQKEHIRACVEEQLNAFDLIIADGPCVTAFNSSGMTPDTLADVFDAVILTAASASTPASEVRRAAEKLRDAGANLIGAVLNDRSNPDLRSEVNRQFDKFGWLGALARRIVMPLVDRFLVTDMRF